MNCRAVIFDLDGVLIDSELHWLRAEMNFLRPYGITLTRDHVATMSGRSLWESVVWLKDQFNLAASVAELMGEKKKHSEAIYDYQAEAMAGAVELLSRLKEQGLVTAIASGSSLPRIMKIVSRLGWEKYFNALVSTDHVELKGKPDPAIYHYASRVLQVESAHCVVLEDSVNGLVAAKGAGMRCIAVPDARWSHGNFSEADLVAQSLSDPAITKFIGIN